jgi:glutamate/aspartate transport system substrate-binding protein
LKKVKENSTFTIGHRDSSIPLSYLDDKLLPVGGINIQLPMSEALKRDIREPNDKPNS